MPVDSHLIRFIRAGRDHRVPLVRPFAAARRSGVSSGYTLLELVAVLVVAGVLMALLAPQFIDDSGFTGQTTADKLLAAARYAETLAQNQGLTTSLMVGPNSFSVTQNKPPVPVPDPTLQSSTYVTPIPSGVTISSSPGATVSFSRTQSSQSVTVPTTFTVTSAGFSASVYVTATGYIYECLNGGPCP